MHPLLGLTWPVTSVQTVLDLSAACAPDVQEGALRKMALQAEVMVKQRL